MAITKYKTKGICAAYIEFEIDDQNRVHNVKFTGGCVGNRQAVAILVEDMLVTDAVAKLRGIQCQNGTSCGDQLAIALETHMTVG